MKLYLFDHCEYCVKVQMAIHLNHLSIPLVYLDNDDVKRREALIGRNVVPILEKHDGTHMAESLDIARYLDEYYEPIRITPGQHQHQIDEWLEHARIPIRCLMMSRIVKLDLPEYKSASARRWYTTNKERLLERSFETAIKETPQHLQHFKATLSMLSWVTPPSERSNQISWDDINLFPTLRNLTVVKDLQWPEHLARYIDEVSRLTRIQLYSQYAF